MPHDRTATVSGRALYSSLASPKPAGLRGDDSQVMLAARHRSCPAFSVGGRSADVSPLNKPCLVNVVPHSRNAWIARCKPLEKGVSRLFIPGRHGGDGSQRLGGYHEPKSRTRRTRARSTCQASNTRRFRAVATVVRGQRKLVIVEYRPVLNGAGCPSAPRRGRCTPALFRDPPAIRHPMAARAELVSVVCGRGAGRRIPMVPA